MKKILKTLAKKSMSLFMAVLMLLSCWVWFVPEKAVAASNYTLQQLYDTYLTEGYMYTEITGSFNGDSSYATYPVTDHYNKVLYSPYYSGAYNSGTASAETNKNGCKNENYVKATWRHAETVLLYDDNTKTDKPEFGTFVFVQNWNNNVMHSSWISGTDFSLEQPWQGLTGESGYGDFSWAINQRGQNNSYFYYGSDYTNAGTSVVTMNGDDGGYANVIKYDGVLDDNTYYKEYTIKYNIAVQPVKGANENYGKATDVTAGNKIYVINYTQLGEAVAKAREYIKEALDYPNKYSTASLNTLRTLANALYDARPGAYCNSSSKNYKGYADAASAAVDNFNKFKPELATYTVTFASADGHTYNVPYKYGDTVTFPANDPGQGVVVRTKAPDAGGHYKFDHWNTKEDGTGSKYTSDTTQNLPVVGGNVTYYARFEYDTEKTHTFNEQGGVTYNGNGTHSFGCVTVDEDGVSRCTQKGSGTTVGAADNCQSKNGYYTNGNKHEIECDTCHGIQSHNIEWVDDAKISEANCSHGNIYSQKCKYCDITTDERRDDGQKNPNEHNWTIVTTESTCTVPGTEKRYCLDCGTVDYEKELPLAKHNTDGQPFVELTGENAGKHGQYCKVCGNLDPDSVTDHVWDYNNFTEVEGTCTKPGTITYKCYDCTATYTEETGTIPHDFDSSDVYVEVKVGGNSKHAKKCANCDAVDIDNAVDHEMVRDESQPSEEATCVKDGYYYEKCTVCGYSEKVIVKADHNDENAHAYGNIVYIDENTHGRVCANNPDHKISVEEHDYKEYVDAENGYDKLLPTCSEAGYHYEKCTVCGHIKKVTDAIDPNAHDMSAATEYDETYHAATCSYCGEEVKEEHKAFMEKIVDEYHPAVAPTCTTTGSHWEKCSVCGYKTQVTDAIVADAHKYGEIVDLGDGTHGRVCEYNEEHTSDVADHTYEAFEDATHDKLLPTCSKEGYHYEKCTVETCGNIREVIDEINPDAHKYGDIVSFDDATHGRICEYDNNHKTVGEAHTYEVFFDAENGYDKLLPTCSKEGYHYEKCSVETCGNIIRVVDPIDPTAHNWDTSKYVCIIDGKDGAHAFNCSNGCGKTGTPDKGEGGTYAHKWSEGVVTMAPTCMAEGKKLHTCEAPGCGATYTEVLAKDYTNHVDENGNAYSTTVVGYVAPTCITEGYSGDKYCDACGKIAEAGQALPTDPDAHRQEALTDFSGTEATCTEPGYADYAYCSDCNKAVSSEDGVTIIPALGHDFEGVKPEKVKDADKHVYSCTRCDEVKYEACSGGKATCKDKAVCEKCDAEYGETTDHTTENAEWVAGGTDAETGKYIHVKKCDVCGEIAETEECAGGNPTCTEAAKCATCGQEHKAARGHDFTGKARPTVDGKHEYKCTRCDVYGAEADCSLTKTETRVAPTCTETAYYKYECDDCGYKWEVKYAEGDEIPAEDAALGHEYTDMMPDAAHLYKEGTCKAEGPAQNIYWYDCSRCNKSAATLIEEGMTEEEIAEIVEANTYAYGAAAEHNFNGRTWYEGAELATEADCENDATYYVYCTVCKTSSKGVEGKEATFIDYNSATEHEWVNDTDEEYLKSEATCVAKAVYYKSCSNCGTKSTITFEHGDVLAHVFEQKILDYAHRINRANCTSMASYWYDCKNCNVNAKNIDKTGMTDEEVAALKFVDEESGLDLTNHTAIETVPVKNPTCTEAGHSAYKICTDCNTPITEKVDYDKLSHDFSGAYKYYVATEEGQKDQHNRKCKNCDAYGYAVDGVQTVDAKVECTFGEWSQVTGTETHEQFCECGNKKTGTCASETSSPSCTEKATCDTCGGKFGETSEHNKATEWTYSDETVGYHVKVCTVCNEVLETQSCYGGTATCGQQAVCEFCNRGYGKTPDHTYGEWIDDAEKPATCTEAKWQYRYCTVCKAESTKQTQQAGKPLGHDISDWYYATEDDKPTCADEGLMTKTCSRCDLKETKVVPVDLDIHDEYIANEIGRWEKEDGAADCVNGVVWYLYCNVCGKKLDSKIESGEHQWKEIANVKATCTEDGYIIYKCDICGFTDTQYPEDMKSEGHVWGEEVIEKQPTCGAAGRAYQLCAKCNAKSEKYAVPATGHGPDVTPQYTIIVEPVAATCTSTGHNGYWKCKRCSYDEHLDESSDYKVYPKLPHTDTDGDGLCDECLGKIYTDDSGKDKSCNCMCHNDSFLMQFFYKIAKFFWKLFGTNKSCACGYEHY